MAENKTRRVLHAIEEATGIDLPDLSVKGAKAARGKTKRTPALPAEKPLAAKPKTKKAAPPPTTTQPTRAAPAMPAFAARPGRKGFESQFAPPSTEPVVSQAGRMGLPVSGEEQMTVAHPSPFGPFATITPRRPHEDVSFEYLPMEELGPQPLGTNRPLNVYDPDAPRKQFDPQQLENSVVIPLYGDRTSAGRRITSINDMPVNVMTYGGPRYGEFNEAMGSPAVWASERSPISALRKQVLGGLEQGKDVYGVYTAMSPRSADQTTMMMDALLQQLRQSDIRKKDLAEYNREARGIIPDFVGVGDTGAYEQLAGMSQGKRKSLVELMDSAKYLGAGFPDVSATRIALTEPDLRLAPAGSTGYSVVKFGPESVADFEQTLAHPTYPVQMAGETMGHFQHMVPFDMLYPELINERRAAGLAPGKDLRAFEFRKPSQVVTPEEIDRLMRYLEEVDPSAP